MLAAEAWKESTMSTQTRKCEEIAALGGSDSEISKKLRIKDKEKKCRNGHFGLLCSCTSMKVYIDLSALRFA